MRLTEVGIILFILCLLPLTFGLCVHQIYENPIYDEIKYLESQNEYYENHLSDLNYGALTQRLIDSAKNDVREIEESLYFIAQRVKHPSVEKNPSYGPTIKLKRIGLNGDILYVNKFRTMHPYSEFLQEYIYDNNKLQDNGKFKDDFRLTGWGQFMRRMWIDELPQFLNYWRGDLNLVGVRALSQHYFNLYPEDLKKFRIQFKPGLVPPYYADMPNSFEEIVQSEMEYLKEKQKHPFKTDIKYFVKAFYNIIFKQARSQ